MSLTRRKPIRLEQLEPRLLLAGDFFTHQHDSHPDSCSCAECCGGGLITDASGTYYFDPAPEFVDPVVQSTDPITDGLDPAGGSGGPTVAATLPLLHSNPTATKKIYLDFDGQNVSGTPWNTNFNNSMTIHAPAFSLDDNISEFSLQEISHIEEIYHRVAEDFSPFDVDVTTESPPEDQFSAGGVAIRVLISTDRDEASLGGTGNQWFSDAGGVAYVNSWNWNSDTPVWVFENNLGSSAKTIAEAASHEIGHSLNLNHDGTSNNDYYRGHGDGDTGWAPIMGVAYDRELTQWSQGEYDDADNTEDDLWQISQRLGFRDDLDSDDPVDAQAATQLVSSGSVNVDIQRVIERTSDIDVFRIDAYGTTNVDLLFSPYETSPNLDIQVDVFDSAGTLLETSNPIDALNASFAATLDPGTYTVAVQGVGQGDVSTGYSDYGSLGQYSITGIVDSDDPTEGGLVAGVQPESTDNPLAPTNFTIHFNQPVDQSSFSLADIVEFTAPDGSTPVLTGYEFRSAFELSIEFEQLPQTGVYAMQLGTDILDLDGLKMDQDQNGIPGEPSDTYSFELALRPDSNPQSGPRVVGLPLLDNTVATSQLTLQFDQLIDPNSFDMSDVVAFSGPSGNNLLTEVTGFSFPTADQVTLQFAPQTEVGFYFAIFGPEIYDLEGLPMDQNGNGVAGDFTDAYNAFFQVLPPQSTVTGDFNDDSQVDATDIDLMCAASAGNYSGDVFDLNNDGSVDYSDVDEMIHSVVQTIHGDLNLDGSVDTSDFNIWNANKFQTGTRWSSGDLNCDSVTDVSDFNVWSGNKFRTAARNVVPTDDQTTTSGFAIPSEPSIRNDASSKVERPSTHDRIWSIFGQS